MSLVMPHRTMHIHQSHLTDMAVKAVLNDCVRIRDPGLLICRRAAASGWHIVKVHVHRRILSLCLELRDDRSSTAYLSIVFGNETVCAMFSPCIRIWDMAHLFVVRPQLSLAYDRRSGTMENPEHFVMDDLAPLICQYNLAIETV